MWAAINYLPLSMPTRSDFSYLDLLSKENIAFSIILRTFHAWQANLQGQHESPYLYLCPRPLPYWCILSPAATAANTLSYCCTLPWWQTHFFLSWQSAKTGNLSGNYEYVTRNARSFKSITKTVSMDDAYLQNNLDKFLLTCLLITFSQHILVRWWHDDNLSLITI